MTLRARDRLTRDVIRNLRRKGDALRAHERRRSGDLAQSLGALALGAMAIGAAAIGVLAIGRLAIGRARIGRLEIDELVVRSHVGLLNRDPDMTAEPRLPTKADPEP